MIERSYFDRAWLAYFKRFGPNANQPSCVDSSGNVREWEGKKYVVLDNVNGILAIYRISNAGQLRYIVRPPKEALADWGYE